MSKQAEGELILKLYELRREETMRKARDWYFREFHPQTAEDVSNAFFGEHGGYFRMVTSYWDMAATLVNNGAIGMEWFNQANGEHFGVFAKIENFVAPIRAQYGPQFMAQLEALVDATPGGRERTAMVRERMAQMVAKFKAMSAAKQ